MQNLFISFEGGEGSGKSTQAKLLSDALFKANIDTILTRAPGGIVEAELIRSLIFNENANFEKVTELVLQTAARIEQTIKLIEPALNSGKIVITDRYFDSTIVYQGVGQNLGITLVKELNNLLLPKFVPNITFLLDINVEDGLKRTQGRENNNRYDKMGIEFHTKIREGYLALASSEIERIIVIDARQPVEVMHDLIKNTLIDRFNLKL